MDEEILNIKESCIPNIIIGTVCPLAGMYLFFTSNEINNKMFGIFAIFAFISLAFLLKPREITLDPEKMTYSTINDILFIKYSEIKEFKTKRKFSLFGFYYSVEYTFINGEVLNLNLNFFSKENVLKIETIFNEKIKK